MRRDSNPQGCGAEETRSVFQRSTQGAERRSGARPPEGGRGIPPSHINNGLSVSQPVLWDVPKVPALKERPKVPAHPPSKDRRPKPERTKSALHLENISPVPKSEPSSTKWRVAPAGRALSLLLYSPAQEEGHIKWPSLRAELATNLMPGPPGPRVPNCSACGRSFPSRHPDSRRSSESPVECDHPRAAHCGTARA